MLIHLVARRALGALLLVGLAARPASAQFDFAGSWAPIGTEDVQNDSVPVDYLGLALTEEGRARALSYNGSQKSTFEHQCQGWGAAYMVLGPFGLRVSTQMDPVTKNFASAKESIDLGYALVGTVDTVTRALEAAQKHQPVDWLFCYTYNALVPHAKLMKSTEALWTKVLPKFA